MRISCWMLTAFLCLTSSVSAQTPAGGSESRPANALPQPFLCDGFNPDRKDWSDVGPAPLGPTDASCAPGYAYLAVNFVFGPPRPGRKIGVVGRCCKLPEGVLLDEHVYALEECPDGTVATGGRAEHAVRSCPENWGDCVKEWDGMDHSLRCTKIDETRFQLGPFRPAYVIGFHQGLDIRKAPGERFTTRTRIPLGLRYGVSRTSRFGLDGGRYVGFPWGSLFAAKRSKFEIYFRELEYRGSPGDPAQGTPVAVVPECEQVNDPLTPNARCVSAGQTKNPSTAAPAPSLPEPGKLGKALLRHEARLLQLFWANSASLEILAASPGAKVDSIVALNPDRWNAASGEDAKDSILANILGPLGEQEFYLQTIRDRDASAIDRKTPTSNNFAAAGEEILPLVRDLEKERSPDGLRKVLRKVSEALQRSTEALFTEVGLNPHQADSVLPLEDDEVPVLKALGIIGADQTIESINLRSQRIVQVLRSRPK